ncbi:helix-turn-helix domain-containing protein [Ruegeria sp. MALMAid1280]|uniref:helix-turn-helix domain-containing protein n=1 Tax=Ruegeria sp. MALMAid1280 TaxID=3411634 RepID=UPI003B9F51A4
MMCFDEWTHHLKSNCGHYDSRPSDRPAATIGRFRMHDRDGLDVAEIDCAIDRIERTRTGIRRDEAEHIFLLYQRSGTTGVIHNGQEQVLAVGESILLDSTLPATLEFGGEKAGFLSAHLPRAICLRDAARLPTVGRKIDAGHPLSGSFQSLLMPSGGATLTQNLPDFLFDLVALAFAAPETATDATRIRDRHHRFGFVRSIIDRNLTNPALTLDWLASEVHMSRRQVQREFQENGTSFTLFLQTRRLKHVAAHLRLAARLQRRPSISGLAYGAGFGDLSHFNHAFRSRYGMSPRSFLRDTETRLRRH